MSESLATTMNADELQLARLVCGRIPPRVQGLLSVGLGFAQSDGPAAQLFIRERFPDLEAHARVLHTIRCGIGTATQSECLQEQSQKVLEAMQQLGRYIAWEDAFSGNPRPILRQMRAAFLLLCNALAEYARLIALEASPIERMKAVCLSIFDHLDRTPLPAEEKVPCTTSIPTST